MVDNISIKEKMDKALKVRNTTEKDTFLTKMGFKDAYQNLDKIGVNLIYIINARELLQKQKQ